MPPEEPLPPLELVDYAGRAEAMVQKQGLAEVVPPDLFEGVDWLVPGNPRLTDLRMGEAQARTIVGLVPDDWTWEGKRVLDFGCCHARMLRHLPQLARGAELWGCDINRAAIEWAEEALSPPLRLFVNDETPPLPLESGSFDLVYSHSVFTHLTAEWSSWLLELRRLLTPDGILIVSFLGAEMGFLLRSLEGHEPWDEDQIGMHALQLGAPWDEGGPSVFHSTWWLRAHWGRAFEILDLHTAPGAHGLAVMRRRGGELSAAELEAPEPGEERELAAALYSLRHAQKEVIARRGEQAALRRRLEDLDAHRADLTEALEGRRLELERAHRELDELRNGGIRRVSRPLRAAGGRLRRGLGGSARTAR